MVEALGVGVVGVVRLRAGDADLQVDRLARAVAEDEVADLLARGDGDLALLGGRRAGRLALGRFTRDALALLDEEVGVALGPRGLEDDLAGDGRDVFALLLLVLGEVHVRQELLVVEAEAKHLDRLGLRELLELAVLGVGDLVALDRLVPDLVVGRAVDDEALLALAEEVGGDDEDRAGVVAALRLDDAALRVGRQVLVERVAATREELGRQVTAVDERHERGQVARVEGHAVLDDGLDRCRLGDGVGRPAVADAPPARHAAPRLLRGLRVAWRHAARGLVLFVLAVVVGLAGREARLIDAEVFGDVLGVARQVEGLLDLLGGREVVAVPAHVDAVGGDGPVVAGDRDLRGVAFDREVGRIVDEGLADIGGVVAATEGVGLGVLDALDLFRIELRRGATTDQTRQASCCDEGSNLGPTHFRILLVRTESRRRARSVLDGKVARCRWSGQVYRDSARA